MSVPKLRSFGQLAQAERTEGKITKNRSNRWHGWPGALAALGLAVCFVSTGIAVYYFSQLSKYTTPFTEEMYVAEVNAYYEKASPGELWGEFQYIQANGLGERKEPEFHAIARIRDGIGSVIRRSLIVAGCGLGVLVVAMLAAFTRKPKSA